MTQYTMPAKERGDSNVPEGYEYQALTTEGIANIISMQNAVIGKSTGKDLPQVKAYACVDEGPLAGKCVLFTRNLDPKHIWSLKYAIRATGVDEGIPLNEEYTFKNDDDIINRVNRMKGTALLKQAEVGNGVISTVNYFVTEDEASKHPNAEPIAREQKEDDFDL